MVCISGVPFQEGVLFIPLDEFIVDKDIRGLYQCLVKMRTTGKGSNIDKLLLHVPSECRLQGQRTSLYSSKTAAYSFHQ